MNNFDLPVTGSIIIKGRSYSAKEVIRGLLELGIAINENEDGLKIGFKHFDPQPASNEQTYAADSSALCPFISQMANITAKLENLSARIESQAKTPPSPSFQHPFSQNASEAPPSSPSFSPFSAVPFQAKKSPENDQTFSRNDRFLDGRQKCGSCGATLPQNAFFCNKCGSHRGSVRSG